MPWISGVGWSSFSNVRECSVQFATLHGDMVALNTLSTSAGLGIAAFQTFVALTSYGSQVNPSSATPYGKFASNTQKDTAGPTISGRDNMLLIYTPALLVNAASLAPMLGSGSTSSTSLVLTAAMTLHFLKRVGETLFLHKYSTRVNPGVGSFIGVYYAAVSWIILHFHSLAKVGPGDAGSVSAGIALFALGEAGNFYHHVLLAQLRDGRSTKEQHAYKVPKGGLFGLVTCPHYLFELVAWLGIALISQEVHSFLVLASMSSYLAGRSVSQTRWAQSNIKDYPKERKNIVPLLF